MPPPEPRPRTAREEQAERLQTELGRRFRHTHDYYPDPITSSRLARGPVQSMPEHDRQMNAGVRGWSRRFRTVRDATGTVGTVARGELLPRGTLGVTPEVYDRLSERGRRFLSPGVHPYTAASGIHQGLSAAEGRRCLTCGGPPEEQSHSTSYVPGYHGSDPSHPGYTSPDAMRWTPEQGESEISEWQSLFNDRRREGRRNSA